MHILLTYDIVNTKNRTKIATLLEGFGLRVNYSVFELDIKKKKLDKLLANIKQLCDKDDSVRVYVFDRDSMEKSFELLGRSKPFTKVSGYVD
ncbi:CRISPR-associated endonuclease Cas2 [Sulfurovum sp.]|uniref:CRISPR-associated endonuclease Cas2 n=1 Tax=Sulfurovum sp. TaxID=1969726 RepID=UPI0025EBD441|nr:CRISPR-associated endonuclease Cas2 [Sulfurovum sp.]